MSNPVSRRQFLGASAAGGALLAGGFGPQSASAATPEGWPQVPPVKIHTVFVGRTGGIYLSRPEAEIAKFNEYLAELEKRLGNVTFVGGELVPPAGVDEIAGKLGDADGVLLFHLSGHGGGAPALGKLVDAGLPTAVFSQPFSGHGWMYFPQWQKDGKKVVLLPTSDWSELDRVVGLMRVAPQLRHTRILVVRGPQGTEAACSAERVKERLGAELIPISVDETIKAHESIPLEEAEEEAKRYWIRKAKDIVEPTHDEIVNSARFFLATKKLMIEHGAHAVTSSNCMGGPAKGCLTYSKLNDLGFVGACEGDMDSTLTMLMFRYGVGIPGFISDPVFDTARNALIHFHCTCATRMAGPASKRLPFIIRTQSDSERGVSLDVQMPIGQIVTCAKFINLDTMLISTGKIIDVTHDELGCRTQFVTEIADARSMFHNWGAGVLRGGTMTLLHRDVFFGDHLQSMQDLGVLMGFNVIHEA
ncbi:MAG: twin-arginine translocation signal domain-containing protein [Candidatus Hydrogenedentes bacterium]|nr:twin-arginine translocation signal domain-containing protein [Candidatus Hydrogenedentota bacterium]